MSHNIPAIVIKNIEKWGQRPGQLTLFKNSPMDNPKIGFAIGGFLFAVDYNAYEIVLESFNNMGGYL